MTAALPIDPGRVEIRCEDCARDLGRSAPTLVVCSFTDYSTNPRMKSRWDLISLGQRRPGRWVRAPGPGEPVPGAPGLTHVTELGGRTFDQNKIHGGRSVELTCRRCKRSGWRRRQRLYALAEQARARGTSDAYLSLG
jgi:hypothetical protein